MRSDTTRAGARDLPAVWEATCARIAALLDGLSDDVAGHEVPTASPATVKHVVIHLIGKLVKAVNEPARLFHQPLSPPAGGSPNTVSTLPELVATWKRATEDVCGPLASAPDLASYLITDAVMCEHDLRSALDLPGARDDVAIKVALDELSGRFSDRVDAFGLPPLRVTVEQWGTIAGTGRAVICVVADRFEFVRAMSGRRSAAEIQRWNWGGDAEIYLPAIGEIEIPVNEVHERDPRIPVHMRDREFVL